MHFRCQKNVSTFHLPAERKGEGVGKQCELGAVKSATGKTQPADLAEAGETRSCSPMFMNDCVCCFPFCFLRFSLPGQGFSQPLSNILNR